MSAPAVVQLPGLDALVEAVLPDGRVHAARVVTIDGYLLTLAATQLAAGVAPPAAGTVLTLRWSGRRGRCAAPVRLVGVDRTQFATWTVQAVGTVEIEQRRRFARAAAHGRVQLDPTQPGALYRGSDEPELGVVLAGELVDIGEGGLRCRLPAGGVDPAQPVAVRVLLDDRMVVLTGAVLRLDQADRAGGIEAVVTFDADDLTAKAIRTYVLHRQRIDRAARTDGRATDARA